MDGRLHGGADRQGEVHTAQDAGERAGVQGVHAEGGRGRRPCWVGHEAGRIAVGHRADLTVFADDPLTTAATDLPDLPVLLTVLDGHPTHRDPSM
ncbi:hypothetical protein [Streptomyces sp. NBC_00208]|uniref:hypothetical protein n=1 Tax=Streptomyces sp. NBC_00208 TaxID=2975681 RepID=UPI003FA6CDEF